MFGLQNLLGGRGAVSDFDWNIDWTQERKITWQLTALHRRGCEGKSRELSRTCTRCKCLRFREINGKDFVCSERWSNVRKKRRKLLKRIKEAWRNLPSVMRAIHSFTQKFCPRIKSCAQKLLNRKVIVQNGGHLQPIMPRHSFQSPLGKRWSLSPLGKEIGICPTMKFSVNKECWSLSETSEEDQFLLVLEPADLWLCSNRSKTSSCQGHCSMEARTTMGTWIATIRTKCYGLWMG